MLTLPSAFTTAAQASGHEPIWLVELPDVLVYVSTHQLNFKRNWRIGEGISIGSGWRIGEIREPYDGRIQENGMGRLRRALDPLGQSSRVAGTQIVLLNHDNWSGTLLSKNLDNTAVRILMGWRYLAYDSYLELFRGVLDNYDTSLTAMVLDITDESLQVHRNLSTPIGSQYFPGAPVANRGKSIPILIGRNTDVTAHKIVGDAAGTLAYTLSSGASELLLNEIGAPFPPSGEITVGTETAVTYTARSYQTINGVTYLQLEGLTRGSPVTQNAGDSVTLTSVTHTHLVGYETGDVTAVRAAGVLVDSADYTVSDDASVADRTVTLIEFDSEPTEPVTVDVDGLNVDPASITNGGFETGDTTGWTNAGSGTPSVTSGAPFGTYKLEFTGSEDSYEDIYAEFATIPGRYYTIELSYKDIQPDTNLLTNGGFESGDLTGWTEDTSQISGLQAAFYTGREITNPQAGSTIRYDDVPEGNLALQVQSDGQEYISRTYAIYQDVATTIGVDYVFGFAHFGHFHQGSGEGVYKYWISKVGYKLAEHDDASIYHDTTLDPVNYGYWVEIPPVSFTAASTTTRVMLRLELLTNAAHPLPGYFDNVQLVQASSMPTSATAIRVGTPSDDDAYVDEELAQRYGWTPHSVSFLASETTTRVTLRSKWTESSAASHFDEIRLHDGGRNPADAIAYMIDTFLPDIVRDTSSFQTAYNRLSGWQFGGIFTNPGDSRALLDDMAWQCNSRLIYSSDGQLKLQVRPPTVDENLVILDTHSIVDGTFHMKRQPLEQLYTEFVLWFGRTADTTDDQPDKNFQASVSANPTTTTHPTAALDQLCLDAQTLFGLSRKLERRASMIRDLPTAHRLLKALVERHTARQYDITVRVFHQYGVHLEEGDPVGIGYSRLDNGVLWLCEVVSKEIGPTDVTVHLRTTSRLGFYEPWDFPLSFTEGVRFVEPWEA